MNTWSISNAEDVKQGRRVWINRGGKLIGAMSFGELRPYVFPLYSPNGRLVLQESPVDHPHHQGLSVGTNLNGRDMWNAGSFGLPRCRQELLSDDSTVQVDGSEVRFNLVVDWKKEDGEELAREERTVRFSARDYGNIVDVRVRFIASYGKIDFKKTKEAGLSMRVPPEWIGINGGVVLDSKGNKGEAAIFDHNSPWVDVSGEGPRGIFAGITLMPHKDSPQVPWMVRDYGLHNYSPWRHEAITVPENGIYELGARYIAHDERLTADEINPWLDDCP